MSYNPIGLFFQPNNINQAEAIRHVRRANYLTCSVLNNLQFAIDIDVPYSVYRESGFEPHPNKSNYKEMAINNINYLHALSNSISKGDSLYYMVNCEPTPSSARFDMYAEMAIELTKRSKSGIAPFGIVVGNFASGDIFCGQGNDINEWYLLGDHFLKTFIDYGDLKTIKGLPALIGGFHEYTPQFAWIVSDGGNYRFQPNAWPNTLNWELPQWHIGRNIQGLEEAYNLLNIRHRIPFIVTECLFDDMQDIPGHYRSFRTLEKLWEIWYPKKGLHHILADMHIWTWEKVYRKWKYMIGTHTYTYGQHSPEWELFRVDN